ncbi:MAG: hypothetical protein MJE77_42620 [Proteobacteria bacterium]|nr:hypothetical protein [Pseudomonadota bacterium]
MKNELDYLASILVPATGGERKKGFGDSIEVVGERHDLADETTLCTE